MNRDDLKPFTSHAPLCEPFPCNEFTCATDGRIIVRVDRLDDCPGFAGAPNANAAELFSQYYPFDREVDWLPLPTDIPAPRSEKCSDCNGAGGWCEECGGTGKNPVFEAFKVGPLNLNIHYLEKLKALPNVDLSPTANPSTGDFPNPMPFRFTGGIGLLMPMRL